MENITIIINKSEITAGTRGSSLGPEAIRTVAWTEGHPFFGNYPTRYIKDVNDILNTPIKHHYAKRIEGLTQIYTEVAQTVKETIIEGRFPLVLAGDHGSAGGTIAGLKALNPDKRIGVVWIDAHGDLHTPYTTPSGNMHGMPLSTALGEDNLQEKRNDIPQETKDLWDNLKITAYPGQKVLAQDLVFVGVRDVEAEEIALMKRLNIRNFAVEEIAQNGISTVIEKINQQLNDCDLIYVSFDVDSMDPVETSHGTGTPVQNGIKVEDARTLLKALAAHPKLACLEVVEINPCLDEKKNKMAETAFDLLKDIVTVLEEK